MEDLTIITKEEERIKSIYERMLKERIEKKGWYAFKWKGKIEGTLVYRKKKEYILASNYVNIFLVSLLAVVMGSLFGSVMIYGALNDGTLTGMIAGLVLMFVSISIFGYAVFIPKIKPIFTINEEHSNREVMIWNRVYEQEVKDLLLSMEKELKKEEISFTVDIR